MVITSFNSFIIFYIFESFLLKNFFSRTTVLFISSFWLHWVFTAAHRLSPVAASKGYSSHAAASLVAEHGLPDAQASVVAAPCLEHRLSSCRARASLLCSMWDLSRD